MIEITEKETFGKVIAEAMVKIDANRSLNSWEKTRWVNAVAKAAARIEDHGAWLTYFEDEDKLVIWSPSNEVYEVDRDCQCIAFGMDKPCWHRAAKQLLKNYFAELESEVETVANPETLPYIKQPTGNKPIWCGNIRI